MENQLETSPVQRNNNLEDPTGIDMTNINQYIEENHLNTGIQYPNHQALSTMSRVSDGGRTSNYTGSVIQTKDPHIRAALQIDPKFVDKNIHETLDRLNSYDLHQRKIFKIQDSLQEKRLSGVPVDKSYLMLKNVIMHNKVKNHEYQEGKKISEIKRNNQHLLDRLLEISKGKTCTVAQNNLRPKRAGSKSLNYVSKKREAERIDRENQRILQRIINVKPNTLVQTSNLQRDYHRNHLQKRKMLQNKNQGIYVEDLIDQQMRFRQAVPGRLLPSLAPQTSTSAGKNSQSMRRRRIKGQPALTNDRQMGSNFDDYQHGSFHNQPGVRYSHDITRKQNYSQEPANIFNQQRTGFLPKQGQTPNHNTIQDYDNNNLLEMENKRFSADDANQDYEEQDQQQQEQPPVEQIVNVQVQETPAFEETKKSIQPEIIYENENESNLNSVTAGATSIPQQTMSKDSLQTKSQKQLKNVQINKNPNSGKPPVNRQQQNASITRLTQPKKSQQQIVNPERSISVKSSSKSKIPNSSKHESNKQSATQKSDFTSKKNGSSKESPSINQSQSKKSIIDKPPGGSSPQMNVSQSKSSIKQSQNNLKNSIPKSNSAVKLTDKSEKVQKGAANSQAQVKQKPLGLEQNKPLIQQVQSENLVSRNQDKVNPKLKQSDEYSENYHSKNDEAEDAYATNNFEEIVESGPGEIDMAKVKKLPTEKITEMKSSKEQSLSQEKSAATGVRQSQMSKQTAKSQMTQQTFTVDDQKVITKQHTSDLRKQQALTESQSQATNQTDVMSKNNVRYSKITTGEPRKQVTIKSEISGKSIKSKQTDVIEIDEQAQVKETYSEEDVEDETEQNDKNKTHSTKDNRIVLEQQEILNQYQQLPDDSQVVDEIEDEVPEQLKPENMDKKTISSGAKLQTSSGRNDIISSKNQQSSLNPSTLEKVQVNYNMQTGVQALDQPSLGESVPQGVFIDYNNIEDSQTSSQPTTNLGLRKQQTDDAKLQSKLTSISGATPTHNAQNPHKQYTHKYEKSVASKGGSAQKEKIDEEYDDDEFDD